MKFLRESFTPRVLLAILVACVLSAPLGVVGIKLLGLEGWLLLLFAFPGAMLGLFLVAREEFYGPRDPGGPDK